MLKWFIRSRLAAFERRYGYDTGYVRLLLDTDTRAFLAYAKVEAMSNYHRGAPKDAWYAAKLVGAIAEDCGPCSQLVVALAQKDGVRGDTLAAVLGGDDDALPSDVRLAVRFARATLAHDPAADDLREQIVAAWGAKGLVSIAFAIASARVFPTVKYALGFGRACQRVIVDGAPVAVVHRVTGRADAPATTSSRSSRSAPAS
jgi:hypothetical protein